MKKRKFVAIEGGEGAGKTGAMEFLRQKLANREDVIFTREPGGTVAGEEIRGVLMDKKHKEMSALTELFLFCASRAQHIEEVIKPALFSGKNVISDRFDASTIAYQIFGRERKDLTKVFETLNNIAKGGVSPDAIIYLDVEPEVGLKRRQKSAQGRHTRFDKETLDFHKRVRKGFLSQYRSFQTEKSKNHSQWHLVPTTKISEKEVKEKVGNLVRKILFGKETRNEIH